MSQKMRGQEVTFRVALNGILQEGSMFKVTDFTATPRTDLVEDDYLGEQETDLDIQHHGFDLSWSVDYQDATAMEFMQAILNAEANQEAHPNITITAIYTFREPGVRSKIEVYRNVFCKQAEQSAGGRKEKVKGKFEGKCKKRVLLNA